MPTDLTSAATVASIIFGLLGLLCSSGALVFFFKYGSRMSVQEHKTNEIVQSRREAKSEVDSKIESLRSANAEHQTRLALLTTTCAEIKQYVSKLSGIDTISAKLDNITHVMDSVLPRSEAEVRFRSLENRVDDLNSQVHKS